MVTSLGISVGNSNSYVAAGQGGGIEMLLNEYSNRSTPSMVAFTDHSRSIGKPYKELALSDGGDRPNYQFQLEEASDGQALVVVRHLGEERKFTITQVLAMLFTKLRDIARNATDCVISYPQFYNDAQKAALLQAAVIAGLNPLSIISDMSAVLLNYAYFRTTKEDPHKITVFINFGHSNLQCAIAWLTPRNDLVRILAAESESIGGKDFDRILAEHFVRKNNLTLTPKSHLKLVFACEKLKKLLSANANDIPIHVESLVSEDKDFTDRINRATFEELCKKNLEQVEACFKRTLANAMINFDKFKASEAATIAEVARAAQAAKEAKVAAKAAAKVAKEAAKAKEAKAKEAEAPKEASEANEANDKKANNHTEAHKDGDDDGAPKQSKDVEMIDVEDQNGSKVSDTTEVNEPPVEPQNHKELQDHEIPQVVELMNLKFVLEAVELVGGSTRIPAIKKLVQDVFNIGPSTTLNIDEAVARGCVLHCATQHPGMKVKRNVSVIGSDSIIKPGNLICDKELRRIELELITSDRKYKSRTEARNSLEEYIYSERSKLQEGDQLLAALLTTLDWLSSDEGEEATEDEYNKKLEELKKASEARLIDNNSK